MADTDVFSDTEIVALTAVGESESLGETGMQQTINTIMNRVAADKGWMGGNNARQVCLQKNQYDAWWPQSNNEDRSRILAIGTQNPTYGPYVAALQLASDALSGNLCDITSGAVSYYDSKSCPEPYWARGKSPCAKYGDRFFYNLSAVQ